MYVRLTPKLTEPEADWEAITEYVAETLRDSVLAAEPLDISEYVSETPRDVEPDAGTP
jgi:hypothetical protein